MGKDFSHACFFRILRLVEPGVRAADRQLPFSLIIGLEDKSRRPLPRTSRPVRAVASPLGVLANLALLGYFKYSNFLIDNVNMELGTHFVLSSHHFASRNFLFYFSKDCLPYQFCARAN